MQEERSFFVENGIPEHRNSGIPKGNLAGHRQALDRGREIAGIPTRTEHH